MELKFYYHHPTAPDNYVIFLSPLAKNQLSRTNTSHQGFGLVLQSQFFCNGGKNIALLSGTVGMMGHKNLMYQI